MKTQTERADESQLVRDWLEHQIKKMQCISDEILREQAIESVTAQALFRLAHIWLGDLKIKLVDNT